MKILGEFKEFVSKGNVVDLAVGVIIGGAFKAIVDSLVNNILMPCISLITGKVNISSLSATIIAPAADGTGGLVISYGAFIEQIINFFIIAFSIFMMVKFINSAKKRFEKKEAQAVEEVSAPTTDELLTEIRDLLKEKN